MLSNESKNVQLKLPRAVQALTFAALGTFIAMTGSVEADNPKPPITITPTLSGHDSASIDSRVNQVPAGSNGAMDKTPTATQTEKQASNLNRPGSIIVKRSQVLREHARTNGVSTLSLGESLADGAIDYNVVRNVSNINQALGEYRARGIQAEADAEVTALEQPSQNWQDGLLSSIFSPNKFQTAYPNLPSDLIQMEFPTAWAITQGKNASGIPIRIAILDTGIAPHRDLGGKIVYEYDTTGSLHGVTDKHGHGTHVAGLAGARINSNAGIAGGAPEADLVNIKVLGDGGSGSFSTVISGIDLARKVPGVKVISMSLGANGECIPALQAIIDLAVADGISIVAAAGNDGIFDIHTPANCNGVNAIGAVNEDGSLASFTNRGSKTFFARGVMLNSTYRNGEYTKLSGTSMATPRAASLFALLRTQQINASNTLSSIITNLDNLPNYNGLGRINGRKAFGLPIPPPETATPAPTPTPRNTPTVCESPMVIKTENKGSHLSSTMRARSGNFRNPAWVELNSNRATTNSIVILESGGPGQSVMTLRIERFGQDGPMNVPLLISDDCERPWQTFIGYGMSENRPWTQTPTLVPIPRIN